MSVGQARGASEGIYLHVSWAGWREEAVGGPVRGIYV